jgi:hypothetical protein
VSYAFVPLLVALITSLPGVLRAVAVVAIAFRAKTDDLPAIAETLSIHSRQIGRKRKSG